MEQPDFGGKSALTERKDDQLVTMDNNAGDASREALSLPQVVHLPPSSHLQFCTQPGFSLQPSIGQTRCATKDS